MILGTETTASVLGLPNDAVEADRQALHDETLERHLPAIDEFMSRPENQRRLRSRDTRHGRPETPICERIMRVEWSPRRQAWEEVTREFEHGEQTTEVHRDLHSGEVTFEKHGDINGQPDDGPGGSNSPRSPQDP